MRLNSRSVRVAALCALAASILVVTGMAALAAIPDISALGSSTHPSEAAWYADDAPSFEWTAYTYPNLLGSIDTTGQAYEVAVNGNVAYVADMNEGLAAFDITDPSSPVCLDTIDAGVADEVCVAGDVVYVAGRADGLFAIDASDPEDLRLMDTLSSAGGVTGAWSVDVSGDFAYITGGESAAVLQSVDVSDPENLLVADTFQMHNEVSDVSVAGDVAYVAENDWGMFSIDISDPYDMFELDRYLSNRVGNVEVSGDVAYISPTTAWLDTGGIKTVDISDPENMVTLDIYDDPSIGGRGLCVAGDLVFQSTGSSGVLVYDVSDPTAVSVIGSYDTGSYSVGVTVHGDTALVAAGTTGLVTLDIMDYAATPNELDTWVGPGGNDNLHGVAVEGDVAYVANDGVGLTMLDISDPESVSTYASFDTTGTAEDVAVQGNVAYIADKGEGLVTVDVTDPSSPTYLGSWATTDSAHGIAVAGNVAYLAAGTDGMQMLDVTDPADPVFLGAYDTSGTSRAADVEGDMLYFVDQTGLRIIDVSDPANPSFVGEDISSGFAWNLDVERGYAYVAYLHHSLKVFDVSDPSAPALVGSYTGLNPKDVKVAGDRAYVTAKDTGVVTSLDISDPTSPTAPIVFSGVSEDVNAVAISGDVAYAAFQTAGLVSLQIGSYPVGYSYALDQTSDTEPDGTVDGTTTTKAYAGVVDGASYFHVKSVDRFGSAFSSTLHRKVQIDTTGPTTDSDAVAKYSDSAKIELTAEDLGSGVASIDYELDGGSSVAVAGAEATVDVDGVGEHSIRYRAKDNVDNLSGYTTKDFSIVSDSTDYIPVAGANRYMTAIETSKRAFPDDANTVVIATGENWPDALGGASLAAAMDGPILLTKSNVLPDAVLIEIDRLKATQAIILGGDAAVGTPVQDALMSKLGASNVIRIGGSDRYRTAELVAKATVTAIELGGATYDGTAFVATGANFPDALAASPLAAAKGWPIFLVKPGRNPATGTMGSLGMTDALILGGTGVISAAQEATLESAFPDSVDRLSGNDRYGTGVAVATYGVDKAGLAWDGLALSTGMNFPDALAGGVFAGKTNGSVMLLTKSTSLPGTVRAKLSAERDWIGNVYYLGGEGAISQAVRDAVAETLH